MPRPPYVFVDFVHFASAAFAPASEAGPPLDDDAPPDDDDDDELAAPDDDAPPPDDEPGSGSVPSVPLSTSA